MSKPSAPNDLSPGGSHGITQNARNYAANLNRFGFQHFTRRKQPSPGAQQYSYDNHRTVETPVVGNAVAFPLQFQAYQPVQAYMNNPAVTLNGLGGILNTQIYLQPLVDPYA